jgi:hypothetical protein
MSQKTMRKLMTDIAPLPRRVMGIVVDDRHTETTRHRHRRKGGTIAVEKRGTITLKLAEFDQVYIKFRAHLYRVDRIDRPEPEFLAHSDGDSVCFRFESAPKPQLNCSGVCRMC